MEIEKVIPRVEMDTSSKKDTLIRNSNNSLADSIELDELNEQRDNFKMNSSDSRDSIKSDEYPIKDSKSEDNPEIYINDDNHQDYYNDSIEKDDEEEEVEANSNLVTNELLFSRNKTSENYSNETVKIESHNDINTIDSSASPVINQRVVVVEESLEENKLDDEFDRVANEDEQIDSELEINQMVNLFSRFYLNKIQVCH